MQRQTKELKLPASGYTVHLATYWTYADRQALTRLLVRDTKVDAQTAKAMQDGTAGVQAENAIDYQLEAIKRATIKLIAPDGTEEPTEDVVNLPDTDVDIIFAELNAMPEAKKKSAQS